MKNSIPENVKTVLNEIGETQNSATWDCHGTVVILHKALEKVAAHKGITFDAPVVIESSVEKKMVVMLVTGRFGDKVEWSFGEAAPYNLKNNYPFAMAEKRAKDRVILKLVGLHGDAYSEIEADEFKESRDIQQSVSDEIQTLFNSAFKAEDSLTLTALMASIDDDVQTELFNSFPSGKITKSKEKVRALTAEGLIQWDDLVADISNMIKQNDKYGAFEAVNELSKIEKKHLAKQLGETAVENLRKLTGLVKEELKSKEKAA